MHGDAIEACKSGAPIRESLHDQGERDEVEGTPAVFFGNQQRIEVLIDKYGEVGRVDRARRLSVDLEGEGIKLFLRQAHEVEFRPFLFRCQLE